MTHFVFCHGWGFDAHFWHRLSPFFSREKCSFVDLGYFGHRTEHQFAGNQAIIGVGHSMGLSKLLSMHGHFHCLIGLNGFTHFLGSDQSIHRARTKELKALRKSFAHDSIGTLKKFYERCGAKDFAETPDFSKLDAAVLLSDLQWLEKECTLPHVPTLILTSDDDVVVPLSITSDNLSKHPWVTLGSIADTGHALGFCKPNEVYKKMMSFLDDRKP